MFTQEYEKLHAEYIQCLVEYHNAYIAYIQGRQARDDYPRLRKILRQMKRTNAEMIKSLLGVRKGKVEANKDKYQEQRTRNKKDVDNN